MKLLAAAAAVFMLASQAFAGSYQTKCETTSVPYQETVKATPGQVAGGAVIGGVIGKVVTKEDVGAVAGAVIGGVVANEKAKRTVTRYKDVQTCKNVYVPARITDEQTLRQDLQDLSDGKSVSKETIMDMQYTIGVAHDGKWGPMSRRAADKYLANLQPNAPTYQPNAPTYSLLVNNVVITSSGDVSAMDQMKRNLQKAGVDAQIVVN